MSEARKYLNTSDECVSDILRLATKALACAYQTTYDMPKDLPDGWIGIRVDILPERLTGKPTGDANAELQRLLNVAPWTKTWNASKGEAT
ncbi:hypothetical protein BBC27_05735 [Acidithiobacillus ferrivorans]|uniref:Uncharacterized protein n=1 Tax=Acidithiobacillus ferrivorans TaxID=160808 RepID=A0A1B9C1S1_9PROT|nr:hypothetical protein [Acidithiobacillus ferrivorans]OCB03917.1 hypothetical protein BBC27_05735 [Acidithiobacillus ferrivorans]